MVSRRLRHNAIGDVVLQTVQPFRGFADRETGRRRYGRQHAFEPLTGAALDVRRQLGRDDRCVAMDLGHERAMRRAG